MRPRAFLIFAFSLLFSQAFLIVQASASVNIVVYGNKDCERCLKYMAELEDSLKDIGVTNIQIRDLGTDPKAIKDLHELNERLGVPLSMRGSVAVVVDDRFVFEGYVPVEVIIDFLAKHKGEYRSFVVYRDERRNLYTFMDERGEIRKCRISRSIQECFQKPRSPYSTSPPILPLIFTSGLLDGVNPCAFAVLLFFLASLFAAAEASPRDVRKRVLKAGLAYIASVYAAYFSIGLGMLKAISLFPYPNLVARFGAFLIIALGAVNVKDYFFYGRWFSQKVPLGRWDTIAKWIYKATIPSACAAGLLVALFEFPCTGGIYVAILGMLAAKTTQTRALMYLLVYNVAFVLPLIAILAFAYNERVVERLREWQRARRRPLRLTLGLSMVALGALILAILK